MQIYENAALSPFHRPASKLGRFVSRYGIHDAQGRRIRHYPILVSLDSSWPYQPRRLPVDCYDRLPGEWIYCGLLRGQFGHFITECLPNLITAARARRSYPDAPIIAHTFLEIDVDDWKARNAKLLDYFCDRIGLDLSNLHFVRSPVMAEKLIMPDAPFRKKFHYQPWLWEEIDQIWDHPDHGEKLYLSRARFDATGSARVFEEDRIEDIFTEYGYRIVYLEDHDLDTQLRLVAGAPAIAGPQGSALHWSLYSRHCTSVLSLGFRSHLQRGICQGRGQAYREIAGKKVRGGPYRLRRIDTAELRAALDT